MAFVKNIEVIYAEMERQNIRLWQVFDQNKNDIIGESTDDDNLTINDSIQQLKNLTDTLDGLIYVVIRRDGSARKNKAIAGTENSARMDVSKGIYKFQVMLGDSATQRQANTGGGIFGGNNQLVTMVLNANKENFEMQLKHIQEKHDLQKSFDDRMKKLEDKLSKGGDDFGGIPAEYAKEGLTLLKMLVQKNR